MIPLIRETQEQRPSTDRLEGESSNESVVAEEVITLANKERDSKSLEGRVTGGAHIVTFKPSDVLADGFVRVTLKSNDSKGTVRTIELEKKDKEGNRIPDDERQERVTQKFAELKCLLGLGKKDRVNYNVTQHILILLDRSGSGFKSYDLYSAKDLLRLSKKCNVDEIIQELAEIRKQLTGKECLGVEVEKYPVFLQDYMGRVDGSTPFDYSPTKSISHRNLPTIVKEQHNRIQMHRCSVIERLKIEIESKEASLEELNPTSQQSISAEDRESLKKEIAELINLWEEVNAVKDDVMLSVLQGVRGYGHLSEGLTDEAYNNNLALVAKHVADETLKRIASKKGTTEEQRDYATGVGGLVFHLFQKPDSQTSVRPIMTKFMQSRGLFIMPKSTRAEDFLLHHGLNIDSESSRQYHGNALHNEVLLQAMAVSEEIISLDPADRKKDEMSLKERLEERIEIDDGQIKILEEDGTITIL